MSFVWMGAMIASVHLERHAEGALDTRAESEQAGFRALVDGELTRSYRLAGLLLGSAADAEDAVGDALERAWRERRRLRDPDRFQAWFDRILVNLCRDRLRRRQRVRFVPIDGAAAHATADPFVRFLDEDAALQRLAPLDDDERVVVVLHYWADLTLDAIAARMGWPPGTVRSRLHRAIERMRSALPDRSDPVR